MVYQTIQLEQAQHLVTVTLNRPEKRNAISDPMINELHGALDEIERGPARVAILTGAGPAFCAGMDLDSLRSISTFSIEEVRHNARKIARLLTRINAFPKPLVAAVRGAALAGGCGVATLCDFTLAEPEARFGYPEVCVGFIPAIVSAFVMRQVGEKRARDLLLSGRILSAGEARTLGLVGEIVPAEKLMARARELAVSIAQMSPTALFHTKRLLVRMRAADLEREVDLGVEASAEMRGTADFREGVAAFLEKRKPIWTGR
jgi:methylglutaconyl-CoA hydratase